MLIGCLMQLYVGTFHVVSAEIAVTMGVPIENPVDCEVWGVIRFLQENVRPCDIHCRLVIIYGKGIILSCHRSHARFKQTASTQKLTASYSKTVKGVLLINFMPHNMKINSNAYCATLEHLCRAIQNQWRGKLSHGIVLLMTMHLCILPGRHKPWCMSNSIGTSLSILRTVCTWHCRTFSCFQKWRSTLLVNAMQMMKTRRMLSWPCWITRWPHGMKRVYTSWCLNVKGNYME